MRDNIHYPSFKRVEGSVIVQLRRIIGEENVLISNELRQKYAQDKTEGWFLCLKLSSNLPKHNK
jgi:hypothetical protein